MTTALAVADPGKYQFLMAMFCRASDAANLLAQGSMSGDAFTHLMGDLTLRAMGVVEPSHAQVKRCVQELEVAYSFLSPPPNTGIPDN